MARCRRNVSTACEASAVTGLWSLRATCSAGSSPNTFGSANSVASSSTAATRMYFQRAYSSISGAFQRALGHQLGDLDLLHLDAHAVGDLEGNEGVANIGDPAEQASGGHHLIPGGELRHQRLVLLGALLLRTDQHEIKQGDERRHEQRELELAAGGAGCRLCPGVGDQGIHVRGPGSEKGGIMPPFGYENPEIRRDVVRQELTLIKRMFRWAVEGRL